MSQFLSKLWGKPHNVEKKIHTLWLAAAAALLALLPASWIFWGRWYGDGLDSLVGLDAFTLFAAVCLVGSAALIFALKDRPPFPAAAPAGEPQSAGQISRLQGRIAWLLVAAGGAALLFDAAVCLARRRLPGVELPALLLLMLAGLALRSQPASAALARVRRALGWFLPALFFTAALLYFFYLSGSASASLWLGLVPLGAAAGLVAFVRRRIPAGAWLFWLALGAALINLDHWLFTVIGDEFAFYNLASEYAALPLARAARRLFECCAVYGAHPFFSTALQAAWMKVFGVYNFGWRSLNPFLCALAVPLCYSFFTAVFSRRAALTAAFCLACSSYLLGFSKIGYNNLQAYFMLALVLACLGWVARARSLAACAGLGLACGLCFYVYPAALYILPLPLVLLPVFYTPAGRKALAGWACFFTAAALLALPMLAQPRFWGTLKAGTVYYTPELVQSWGALAAHLAVNLRYAFFSGWAIPEESHFVVSAYLDPLSAGLAWLGLAAAAGWLRRSRFLAAWLAGFALMLLLAGASHDRPFPPVTRMFMLLPWFAGFTALGLEWLLERFGAGRRGWAAALAVILLLNLAGAYWLNGIRNTSVQSVEVLFMRLVQNLARQAPHEPRTFLFLSDSTWGVEGFTLFQRIYPQWLAGSAIIDADLSGPLPQPALELAARNNTVVIETPSLPAGLSPAVRAAMQSAGKRRCYQRTLDGQPRFSVWYTPSAFPQGDPCAPPAIASARLPGLLAVIALAAGLDFLALRWLRRRRLKSSKAAPRG